MAGYDHDSFWDQTPHTLSLTFEAYNEQLRNLRNDQLWMAWNGAAMQRAKKMPSLQSIMIKKRTRSTLDDQLEGLKNWVQATGGVVIHKH